MVTLALYLSGGDSLAIHNDMPFTTYDRDNDRGSTVLSSIKEDGGTKVAITLI